MVAGSSQLTVDMLFALAVDANFQSGAAWVVLNGKLSAAKPAQRPPRSLAGREILTIRQIPTSSADEQEYI
jgi:hypothetical protein